MELDQLLSSQLFEWVCETKESERKLDELMAAASDMYERASDSSRSYTLPALIPVQFDSERSRIPTSSTHSTRRPTPPPSRFASPSSDKVIQWPHEQQVSKNTQRDMKFCMNLWNEWTKHRLLTTSTHIRPLVEMTTEEMQYWMTRFILEARKKDGEEYPPNTLHHIVCGLM